MQFVRFQLKCYTNKTVADFTSEALIMFLCVVKAMSMRVCDVSVTLVGSFTNCVKLRAEQKLDKARPSEQFPCRLQFRSPIMINSMPVSRESTKTFSRSSRKLVGDFEVYKLCTEGMILTVCTAPLARVVGS